MEMSDVLAEGLEEALRDMYPLFRLLEAFNDGHELKEHHVEMLLDAGLFDLVEDEEHGQAVEISEDGLAYFSEGLSFFDDAVTSLEEAGLLSADNLEEAEKPVLKTAPHGKLPKGVRDDIEGSREGKSPSDFLDQKNKKYPVKDNGQLRLDLVMAAEKRARLNGDEAIEKKAAALRKKLQKEESVATMSQGLVSAQFPFYTILSGFEEGAELSEDDIDHLIESGYLEDSDDDTVQLSDSGLEYLESANEFLDGQIDRLEEAFGLTGEEVLEESEVQSLEERQASDEAREIASTVAQKFVGSPTVMDELQKRGVKNAVGELMTMLRNGELSLRSARRSSDVKADAKLWAMVNRGELPKDVYELHQLSQGRAFSGKGAPLSELLKQAKAKGIANPAKVALEMLRGKDPMGLHWFDLKSRMRRSRGRKFKESLDSIEEAVASSKPFSLAGGRVKGKLESSTKNSSLLRIKGLVVKFGKKSWSGEVESFNPGLARTEKEFEQDTAHKIRVDEPMSPAERRKVIKLLWSHPEIQKLADA